MERNKGDMRSLASMELSSFFPTFAAWLLILGALATCNIYYNEIFVQQGCVLKMSKNQKCKCAPLLLPVDLHGHE